MSNTIIKKKEKKDYNEELFKARIELAIAQYETTPQRIYVSKKKKNK